MSNPTESDVDVVFDTYQDALGRVRTMTDHPAESSRGEHAAVADELAKAYEALTRIELVTSEQLAPFVTESGIALGRQERAVHPEYNQTYGTLDEILKRMEDGL